MNAEFQQIVDHFLNDSQAILRDDEKIRHSPVEIELLNGLDETGRRMLRQFFGEPVKSSGNPADYDIINNPVVKKLGGAYVDQTVYLKNGGQKECFYAALWPWHIHPGVVTLHLGIHGGHRIDEAEKMLSDFHIDNPEHSEVNS